MPSLLLPSKPLVERWLVTEVVRMAGLLLLLAPFLLVPVAEAADAFRAGTVLERMMSLNQTGTTAEQRADYPAALAAYRQGLVIAREQGHKKGIGVFLINIGKVYSNLGDSPRALDHSRQALAIHRELGDRHGEVAALTNIGVAYRNLGDYPRALDHSRQALAIHRELGDRHGEAAASTNIGRVYKNHGEYSRALDHHRQALAIHREIGDRRGEGAALSDIGIVHDSRGDYPRALDHYRQAVAIMREIRDHRREGGGLGNIGIVYWNLGDYPRALEHYRQALAIHREIGDRRGEGATLVNIGNVYSRLGDYPHALHHSRQALAIHREIGDRRGEGIDLGNIGIVYWKLGDYPCALHHHRQALVIRRAIDDRRGEGADLGNIGSVYLSLGDYPRALDHYRQALTISRRIGDRRSEGAGLGNIGSVYLTLGDYPLALEHYEQALTIGREIGDRHAEGTDLGNIGMVYDNLGDHPRALDHYRQALAISREVGDRRGEGRSLTNIGKMYSHNGDHPRALDHYRQALAIQTETAAPDSLWRIWSGLRQVLTTQARPQAAILAGKQAVNTLQKMRGTNQTLDPSLQRSFLSDRTFVYQRLADLLIEQHRPAEAQQVLDMLKESEFYDYIQQHDGHDPLDISAAYNAVETRWNEAFEETVADLATTAKALVDLTRIHADIRTSEQQAEIARLTEQRDALSAQVQLHLDDLITDLEATPPARQAALDANMNRLSGNKPGLLETLSQHSGTRTGLLQFILLPNTVRVLLTTPDGWQTAVAEVDSDKLNDEIERLRKALTNLRSNPKPAAQALYQRLVAPLAAEIDTAGIESLLVQLDGELRYIPFAALHDGDQWLAERWPLVYYTAASERQAALAGSDWRVAGLGTSEKHGDFEALPAVPGEVNGIVREAGEAAGEGVLPGVVHLDADFTRDSLWRSAGGDHNILHIASHFDLKPGNDTQSSLLLGDGNLLSLRELRQTEPRLDLRHIDLVTLSACNTAMGGAAPGSDVAAGAEIEGMGAIVQRQGARGVLASLWKVADASTGKLMQTLYRLRAEQPELSKAEALQQAQFSLLHDTDPDRSCEEQRALALKLDSGETREATGCNWRHPYYWAPFILMGNWL